VYDWQQPRINASPSFIALRVATLAFPQIFQHALLELREACHVRLALRIQTAVAAAVAGGAAVRVVLNRTVKVVLAVSDLRLQT
jgi:hypothetical protein